MSRIAMFVFPEGGHLQPSMAIARAVVAGGHTLTVCSVPDLEDSVCAAGMAFEPVLHEQFPRGSMDRMRGGMRLRMVRSHVAQLKTVIQLAGGPSVRAALHRLRPEVCLIDSPLFIVQLAARELNVPSIVFHVTLPWDEDDGMPPLDSIGRPGRDVVARVGRFGARLHNAFKRTRDALLDPLDLGLSLRRRVVRAAYSAGVPHNEVNPRNHPVHIIATDEIILCPSAFDFPRPAKANRHYVGPTVAAPAENLSFPFERLEPFKHVIYCAFGSRTDLYRKLLDVQKALTEIVFARSDMHAVIVSESLATDKHDDHRLTIVRRAPQLAVLAKASAFVTHAGLGSVKESILAGVPMVAVPMVNDQFGNAARIEYHHLGVRLAAARVTVPALRAAIDHVLASQDISESLVRMQQRFALAERESPAIRVIERLTKPHPAGSPPS